MKNIEIFQAPTGEIEFHGDVEHETVWASLDQIAKLFNRDKSGISRHIKNVYKSEELEEKAVDSKEATHFRKWATSILKKYLINGYAVNEKNILEAPFKHLIFESAS